jgi:UDP:flavonoid glycosyltransferase YjiC (YdhE family)
MQERLGLGKVLDYKSINADRLKEAVVSVLEDEQIRENQRKIREEIAPAPGNAGAVRIIEAFMQRQFFTNP